MATPTFTEEQKEPLSRLGLFDQQIKAVESVLPTVQALLGQAAPLTDVREPIESLGKALASASLAIAHLCPAYNNTSAKQEARLRLQLADFHLNRNMNGETLDTAAQSLATTAKVVERALQHLPRDQRRHRANPLPIATIERALLESCDLKLHTGKRFPPFLKPSASEASPFREIIEICYAAAGAKNSNPERAIKAHIAQARQARKTRS